MKQIYLDMDGVLADFDKKKYEVFGPKVDKLKEQEFWKLVWENHPNWFFELEPMPDMELLWGYTKRFKPIILTAASKSHPYAIVTQKQAWVKKWLGSDVPVIVCFRSHKKDWAAKDAILVDDHADNIKEFTLHGGMGILHTSAANSIAAIDTNL